MEKRLNEYELLYIVHPRKAADETASVIDWVDGLVQQGGGEVLTVDDWGRRRLAYPISHEFEGTYVLTTLRLPPASTGAIESRLVISEDIMRHVLIRGIIPFEGSREQPEERERPAPPPQTAAGETPAGEAPASDAAVEQPAAEQPEAEQPAVEQPAAEQPEAEQPEADQPAAEQPAAEEQAAEQPAAEQPAAEQPAAEQPAAEQPAAEQPEAEQPAAEQPAAEEQAERQKTQSGADAGEPETEASPATAGTE